MRNRQHVLVLPDLEESLHETAALARIWQDVKSKHPTSKLTAVFCGQEGSRVKLKDGEKLLARDRIDAIYSGELQHYCQELLGQKRLSATHDSS